MYLFILQTVRSIEDPEKNPKAVGNWIDSIRCDTNLSHTLITMWKQ